MAGSFPCLTSLLPDSVTAWLDCTPCSAHPAPVILSPADARPASTDVRLEATDLRLTLSPDVLELGALLAASALEPLMQAGGGCRLWARLG